MSDVPIKDVPMTHWLVAGAGLIWSILGFAIYLMTVRATPEMLAAQYNAAEIEFMTGTPLWATSAYAIAVNASLIGCALLLFRKSLALPVLIVSLLAVLVQDLHSFVLNDAVAIFGMVPVYIQGAVIVIGIALIFYARAARARGLLS